MFLQVRFCPHTPCRGQMGISYHGLTHMTHYAIAISTVTYNTDQTIFSMFSQRWKPVMNNDDFPQQEDDEERHPSIIKNGGADDTVLSELDAEKANIANDLTTVTWTSDEKDEKEEKKDDEKIIKDEKEELKKEEEKKEDKATEDTPLQEEENLTK